MFEPRSACPKTEALVGKGIFVPAEQEHLEECSTCRGAVELHRAFAALREAPIDLGGASAPRIWFRHQLAALRPQAEKRRLFRLMALFDAASISVAALLAVLFVSRWRTALQWERLADAPVVPALTLFVVALAGLVVSCRRWAAGKTAL